ncbi:MAG TPA: histidine phosphotransferase family protein [Acetobacteraceae bacterium]|nr:histidine phosphotransferase family protein [Acetobacteraceae bacterium]
MAERLDLAQALCARFCHELGGPVGTLMTVMELGPAGGEAEALARSAVETLRRRLRLFRALAGGAEDFSSTSLEECLEGSLAHGRVALDVSGLAPGALVRAADVPVVLAAILLASEALPRGGAVRLLGNPAAELIVLPAGPGVAWSPALVSLLIPRGEAPALSPRTVLAHLLCEAADRAGLGLSIALGGAEGAALAIRRLRNGFTSP